MWAKARARARARVGVMGDDLEALGAARVVRELPRLVERIAYNRVGACKLDGPLEPLGRRDDVDDELLGPAWVRVRVRVSGER